MKNIPITYIKLLEKNYYTQYPSHVSEENIPVTATVNTSKLQDFLTKEQNIHLFI
jgi:hypothetical protein